MNKFLVALFLLIIASTYFYAERCEVVKGTHGIMHVYNKWTGEVKCYRAGRLYRESNADTIPQYD